MMFTNLFYSSSTKLISITAVVLYASVGLAAPAFEGYFRFYLGNQHAGYAIQRYEVDTKKKEINHAYFVYVKTPSGVTNESLVAKSNDKFEPISYNYSALVDGKPKAVDVSFKNNKAIATVIENGKTSKKTLEHSQGSFLACFLNYLLMQKGLGIGKGYNFNAFSEEDPGYFKGTAAVLGEEAYAGIKSYKVNIDFKGSKFFGYITSNGEIMGTVSPLQDARTELVATKSEAVGSFPFPEKTIKTLFGGIPAGTQNLVSKKALQPPPATQPLTTGKSEG